MNRAAIMETLRDRLQAIEPAGDLATAPAGNPTLYWVLERPPGPVAGDGADLSDPEAGAVVRLRLRTVSTLSNASVGTLQATDLSDRLVANLLDRSIPITGDGWAIVQRDTISTSGDIEGSVANILTDLDLLAVAAT